eukprot:gnl/TRDRNA2_/TRDRNA2_35921_c0_seq1.p1 gnl/TRDRNA2_/TRDRNA2_35921_c0~~gnl/TRDRNA2_/TRDRNA2_35921_c0_seq1.p1  ORF type:complete len:427 (-),score=75.22 gnl/TRDRNA2_/TRDRNA2_35921_c0_seq1:90-1211(-)
MRCKPLRQNPWIGEYAHVQGASARVYLFYGPGASGQSFDLWRKLVREEFPELELCVVELPGHGEAEGPYMTDVSELTQKFAIDIISTGLATQEWFSCPFAFVGLSMGAMLAYNIVRDLKTSTSDRPAKFYVVGRTPPSMPDSKWAEEQPLGTLPLLHWVTDNLHASRSEKLRRIYEKSDMQQLRAREALWRADLQLASRRAEPNVRVYSAVTGICVKRKHKQDQRLTQLEVPRGSMVYTTGEEFIGPSGGMWVELSTANGQKPGWLLVHGKTVGMDQELLEPVPEPSRMPEPSDKFWKLPCEVQIHCSDTDTIHPLSDETGRLAPMEEWANFTDKDPDFVLHNDLQHDELLDSTEVMRQICLDLVVALRLREE